MTGIPDFSVILPRSSMDSDLHPRTWAQRGVSPLWTMPSAIWSRALFICVRVMDLFFSVSANVPNELQAKRLLNTALARSGETSANCMKNSGESALHTFSARIREKSSIHLFCCIRSDRVVGKDAALRDVLKFETVCPNGFP